MTSSRDEAWISDQVRQAEAAMDVSDWVTARDNWTRVLAAVGETDDGLRVRLQLGDVEVQLSNRDAARQHFEQTLAAAKSRSNVEIRAAALHRLGHFFRMSEPQRARDLFEQSADLCEPGSDARAVCRAMVGQIDFYAGDEIGGLSQMLAALTELGEQAESREHLIEHIAYFGLRMARPEFVRVVSMVIEDRELAHRIIHLRSPSEGRP